MLGNNSQERRIYLSINHGKVRVQGTKQEYSFIEGTLRDIYKRSSTFSGEEVLRWYIDLEDGGELYSLCLPYSSGAFKAIVLSLASVDNLSQLHRLRIEPYEGKNGFTKVSVYAEGVRLEWATHELPAQEYITVGGKQIKDDSKQMEVVVSYVREILKKIGKSLL